MTDIPVQINNEEGKSIHIWYAMFKNIYSQIIHISEFNIVKAEMYRIATFKTVPWAIIRRWVGRVMQSGRWTRGLHRSTLYRFSCFCTSMNY